MSWVGLSVFIIVSGFRTISVSANHKCHEFDYQFPLLLLQVFAREDLVHWSDAKGSFWGIKNDIL